MKVSIITPSYNQERFIERTIQSVLRQNISELEYFVMDGSSRDDTLSILKKYSDDLYFVSERDHGQAHAVNKGLRMSSGEIIGWLNSDDIYYPYTLEKIDNIFAMHAEVDVIYGHADHIDCNDHIIGPYPIECWNVKRLKKTCYLSQPAVFWRRRVLDQFGLLDEHLHYCMDYEYWLRLALGGATFYYLADTLAGSRLYKETKTMSAPIQAAEETLAMLCEHLSYAPMDWLINYAVSLVKNKTQWRFPMLRYMFAIWAVASYAAFRFNGFFRGMLVCISLPVKMTIVKCLG